jgi:ABC-type glycerol-3-phosphate transport system substrate-binding protein
MLQEGRLAVAALPLSEWQKHGNALLAAELPLVEGGSASNYMYSRFFALPAESSNPEAAVKWLAYITSSPAQLEWLENTGRLPALDELYRSGLPESARLPFDPGLLLSDDSVTGEGAAGRWSDISGAVTQLLTGKVDAAGYRELLSQHSE